MKTLKTCFSFYFFFFFPFFLFFIFRDFDTSIRDFIIIHAITFKTMSLLRMFFMLVYQLNAWIGLDFGVLLKPVPTQPRSRSSKQAIHWIGPAQRGPIGIVLFPRELVRVWEIENKREEDLASSLLRSISSPGPPLLCGVVAESGER